jgi:hypothetical protein
VEREPYCVNCGEPLPGEHVYFEAYAVWSGVGRAPIDIRDGRLCVRRTILLCPMSQGKVATPESYAKKVGLDG